MAILVVDDEAPTREALRDLLSSLGVKTILEAKNGEEALKIAEAERNRLQLMLSDWEMPYMDGIKFLNEIEGRHDFNHIPFVLITSDLSRGQLKDLQAKQHRLDGLLVKPFKKSALLNVMSVAVQNRNAARSCLIYLGEERLDLGDFQRAFRNKPDQLGFAILRVSSFEELKKVVDDNILRLGGLLIEPSFFPDNVSWLGNFSKTPQGSQILLACLGTDAEMLGRKDDLRRNCRFFSSDFKELLHLMNRRRMSAWEVDLLFQELKTAQQAKNYKSARNALEKILHLEEGNVEAKVLLGEILFNAGEKNKSLKAFSEALRLNPFLPRVQIKYIECVSEERDPEKTLKAAQQAVSYCPQSPEVFYSAAAATGRPEFAEKALQLNPNHEGAKKILAK